MIIIIGILESIAIIYFFVSSCTDPGVLKIPVTEEEQESRYFFPFLRKTLLFAPLRKQFKIG